MRKFAARRLASLSRAWVRFAPDEIGGFEICRRQARETQARAAQRKSREFGAVKIGVVEAGCAEIGPSEIGMVEPRMRKIGA